MADRVEQVGGMPPRIVGGAPIAGGVVGLTEADQQGCFEVDVSRVPTQIEGELTALDRLLVVSEVVVGMPEAVQRGCLAGAVTQLLVQVEGLSTIGERVLVPAQQGAVPADVVECSCPFGGALDGCERQ